MPFGSSAASVGLSERQLMEVFKAADATDMDCEYLLFWDRCQRAHAASLMGLVLKVRESAADDWRAAKWLLEVGDSRFRTDGKISSHIKERIAELQAEEQELKNTLRRAKIVEVTRGGVPTEIPPDVKVLDLEVDEYDADVDDDELYK
tara:strand:- start:7784 stop:8227 length:444 start_codon:yes stop_codon:yes gene_type:complete